MKQRKKRASLNKVAKEEADPEEGDAPKTAAAATKKKKDVYLTETGRILADLIVYQQRQP